MGQTLPTIFVQRVESHARGSTLFFFAVGFVVAFIPILMRFTLICAPPCTDEGFYALHSMLAYDSLSSGKGLPPLGVLQLYPFLCSFVFAWEVNHLIALRLCDMLVAAVMAWQLYRLLVQESGSTLYGGLLAVLIVIALNQPLFIQSGFKNSLFAAWIPLLISLRLGLAAQAEKHWQFFFCGALVALSVLLRESFAPFAVLGAMAILLANNKRSALMFIAGGILTAVVSIGLLAILRGGVDNIIVAYKFFAHMAVVLGSLTANSSLYFSLTLTEVAFLAPLGGIVLFALYSCLRRNSADRRRLLFWLIVFFAPLIETLAKGAYPYHYSTTLVGLSGLLACIANRWRRLPWCGYTFAAICVACLFFATPRLKALPSNIGTALSQLANMLPNAAWPEEMRHSSNYLLMTKAVCEAAQATSTLEVSGAYLLVHVLSGVRPPFRADGHLFDLALYALTKNLSPEALAKYIQSNPPEIILVSDRTGFGTDILKAALALMPEYKAGTVIPNSDVNHYGGFTGTVFVKNRTQ